MNRIAWCALLAGLLLSGCGGLQETWEAPGAAESRPKSIAVLPVIVGQYEGAREPAQELLTSSLKKRNRYELVIGHDQVKAAFESSPEVSDALVGFYAKLETLGQSDKDAAVMLGQALQAEALLVVKGEPRTTASQPWHRGFTLRG
ncbi:hypothetical protein MYX04_07735 [Nitrospiraceae bacterium AH_259_D15_M11_P09]|nr:hypothetical protein [Nitrospiraceae bacterium AH_259_D15_M11_P09]